MHIWLLHNLVGNKWIYSLSCANIGKDFDIVKEYTIIFKKETYVVEVQAYNEMGETDWTPVTYFTTTNSSIATSIENGQRDTVKVQSSKFKVQRSWKEFSYVLTEMNEFTYKG